MAVGRKGLWERPQERAAEDADHTLQSPGTEAEATAGAGCQARPLQGALL